MPLDGKLLVDSMAVGFNKSTGKIAIFAQPTPDTSFMAEFTPDQAEVLGRELLNLAELSRAYAVAQDAVAERGANHGKN